MEIPEVRLVMEASIQHTHYRETVTWTEGYYPLGGIPGLGDILNTLSTLPMRMAFHRRETSLRVVRFEMYEDYDEEADISTPTLTLKLEEIS